MSWGFVNEVAGGLRHATERTRRYFSGVITGREKKGKVRTYPFSWSEVAFRRIKMTLNWRQS